MRVPYEGAVAQAARAADRRTICTVIALLALVCCVSMLVPAIAGAADSSVIELIGGTGARSIPLTVHSPAGRGRPVLEGPLRLALQSNSARPQQLRLLLVSDTLPGPILLGHLTLAPGSLREVTATVQLPAQQEPSALDGTVLIDSTTSGATRGGAELSLPVTAAIAPIGDVRFAPDPTVVQVTRGCLHIFHCNTTDGGTVQLYGAGVSNLLAELSAAGESSLNTELRSGSNTLDVQLTELRPDPSQPGTATANLRLDTKPPPGTFTGAIALSPLLPQAPELSVEVHSRYMFAWAVLAIFLGVLTAGYFYQQLGLSRRKRLLREMMLTAINVEYCPRESNNDVDGLRGREKLIWDPELKCPLKDNPKWTYTTELAKSFDIYTAIYWARNDTDLDEAQTAAVTVVKGVKIWLLVITDVRALWELTVEQRLLTPEWEQTTTSLDSHLLLLKAKHTPSEPASCNELLAKVKQQIGWHRCFAECWDLRGRLMKDDNNDIQGKASAVDLTALDREIKPVLTRTADEQDLLTYKLDQIYRELTKIANDANADASTPELAAVSVGDGEREAISERLRNEIAFLQSTTPLTYAQISAGRVISPTDGADEAPEQQPDVAAPKGLLAAINARMTAWRQPWAERPKAPPTASRRSGVARRLRLLDLLMSAAILLATSLLYAVGIYGSSWGSVADWGTAFGAGFGGQVAVKWALLPIYRSLRLRAPTGEAQPAAAAAET
jgi:hypothetical protein